jgi:hypothetical protein
MGRSDARWAGPGPTSPEEMIAEARKAFFVMFTLLAVVWLVQLANAADHYDLSRHHATPARCSSSASSPPTAGSCGSSR